MTSFDDILAEAVRGAAHTPRILASGECQSANGTRCGLCHAMTLGYPDECAIKEDALNRFWIGRRLSVPRTPLVPSPLGRGYRTVSKRKAFLSPNGPHLGFIGPADAPPPGGVPVLRCAIEPGSHAEVFTLVQEILRKPYAEPLAGTLRYVIVKGTYTEYSIIFSVRGLAPATNKALNTLSKRLTHSIKRITGIFAYVDDSDGRYYLGARRLRAGQEIRKIHGKPLLSVRVAGRTYFYSPLSFSQVNESILGAFLEHAARLLDLKGKETLYDLYCGYGLFALALAHHVASVVGVELSPLSVAAANANAARQRVTNSRFYRSNITAESLAQIFKRSTPQDIVLLDPPRGGTAEGVLECIAARAPARILHIFCNIDILPAELARWESSGYHTVTAVPFDMFPGTSSVETMVLLERSADL